VSLLTWNTKNYNEFCNMAHKMKGCASNVRCTQIKEMFHRMQLAGEQMLDHPESLIIQKSIIKLCVDIEMAYSALKNEIENF